MNINERLSEFLSENFVFDNEKNIWVERETKKFEYNDGDEHENYLKDILENVSDKSVYSPELVSYIKDWPSQYHLTSKRSNLLRPFGNAFNGKTILEIGCGCGAITRFLAESGANVVALEGSIRRAEIARKRCEGLENVIVICAPSDKFAVKNFFDYVMLIGVLEYAKLFLGPDGHLKLLQSCREHLKDEGSFFIAIENKLGLKYFAGEKEDHLGMPMIGINDAYQNNGICTYGKCELEALLHTAGFNQLKTYLPFPDYKLPSLIVTPTGWKEHCNLLSPVVSELSHKDPQLSGDHTFSIEQATKSIWRNGMAADLSNSFLYLCRKDESNSDRTAITEDIAAIYYSEPNLVSKPKKIEFRYEQGQFFTRNSGIDGLQNSNESFYEGESVWARMVSIVNTKDWEINSLSEVTQEWIRILIEHCHLPTNYSASTVLPSNMFDALPFNIVIDNKIANIFDLEWDSSDELKLEYIVFRGLFQSLSRISTVENTSKVNSFNICKIIEEILTGVFSDFDKNNFSALVKKEVLWMSKLSGIAGSDIESNYLSTQLNVRYSIPELKHQFYSKIQENNQINESLQQSNLNYLELNEVVHSMDDDIQAKNNEIDELSNQLNIKSHHLNNILSSRAWKIISKLARAKNILSFSKKR